MRRRSRFQLLAVALLLFFLASPGVAVALPADGATIQHDITCMGDVNPPTKSGSAVSVTGAVECTGSVDLANTYITVQILENGAWRNYGNVTTTSSTTRTLILSDGATLKPGAWSYRGRIHREAFHGTWGTNDWYSASRSLQG